MGDFLSRLTPRNLVIASAMFVAAAIAPTGLLLMAAVICSVMAILS